MPEVEKRDEVDKREKTIAIPQETYRAFSEFCDRRHLVMKRVAAALIQWFMQQPPGSRRTRVAALNRAWNTSSLRRSIGRPRR
jgi:hypothetical protein